MNITKMKAENVPENVFSSSLIFLNFTNENVFPLLKYFFTFWIHLVGVKTHENNSTLFDMILCVMKFFLLDFIHGKKSVLLEKK